LLNLKFWGNVDGLSTQCFTYIAQVPRP